MKAKSWKKFVKQKKPTLKNNTREESTDDFEEIEEEEDGEGLMERVLGKNETLKKLMYERNELERKMAELTGAPLKDKYGIKNFSFAEIPTIKAKKALDKKEVEKRKKALDSLNEKRKTDKGGNLDANLSVNIGATNITPIEPAYASTNIGKKKKRDNASAKKKKEELIRTTQKKAEDEYLAKKEAQKSKFETKLDDISSITKKKDNLFDKIRDKKKKTDNWLDKREKEADKVKKTIQDVEKAGSKFKKTTNDLEKFSKDLKKISSNKEISEALGSSGLTDYFDKGSKLLDKLNKPLKAIKTNKSVQSFTKNWRKVKSKQKEIQKLKDRFDDKYKAKRDRLLKVEVGTIAEIGVRQEKLRQKAIEKKRAEEEVERKRQEKKDKRKAEREEERKKENKREKRREERKQRKKEKY